MTCRLFASVLLVLLVLGTAGASAKPKRISMRDVPAVVKRAVGDWIDANAKGGKTRKIWSDWTETEKIYLFEIKPRKGNDWMVTIGSKGTILESGRKADDDDDD